MSRDNAGSLSSLDAITASWPRFIQFENPTPDVPVHTDRARLFAEAFPSISPADLSKLSLAAQLLETTIYETDAAMDDDRRCSLSPLDMMAVQFETYRIAAELFSGPSAFWCTLKNALVDYADMLAVQNEYAAGRRDLRRTTLDEAVALARGKTALGPAFVLALGELSGDRDTARRLAESADLLMVARCFADDALDWRVDAMAGRPSLLVAIASELAGVGARPSTGWSAEEIDRIGRSVYFGGAALTVLDAMADLVRDSRQRCAGLTVPRWTAAIDEFAQHIQAMRSRLPNPANGSAVARTHPGVSVRVQVRENRPWHRIATRALPWLLEQWRLGMPDVPPVRRLSAAPNRADRSSDVLSKALVVNALMTFDNTVLNGQLSSIVRAEAARLLAKLTPAPADLDELAMVLRLTVRAERSGRSAELLTEAVAASAAVEVLATVLSAGERDEFTPGSVDLAVDRITAAQDTDGGWDSPTHPGRLYCTFLCLSGLAHVRPELNAPLRRGLDFLLRAQGADGGWCTTPSLSSDAFGTATALLALDRLDSVLAEDSPRIRDAAERALKWLDKNHDDGKYPAVPFLTVDQPETSGLRGTQVFGAASVTTALVCTAALAWEART